LLELPLQTRVISCYHHRSLPFSMPLGNPNLKKIAVT
jgi:hypothetical protein